MEKALNRKKESKRLLDRPMKRWTDELNQNFKILGVGNSKEWANDREEQRSNGGSKWPIKAEKKGITLDISHG